MHLRVCNAERGWVVLESFQLQSGIHWPGEGEGGGVGRERVLGKNTQLCNSIWGIPLCACSTRTAVRGNNATETSELTRIVVVKAYVGWRWGADLPSMCFL